MLEMWLHEVCRGLGLGGVYNAQQAVHYQWRGWPVRPVRRVRLTNTTPPPNQRKVTQSSLAQAATPRSSSEGGQY